MKTFAMGKKRPSPQNLLDRPIAVDRVRSAHQGQRAVIRQILHGSMGQSKMTIGAPDDVYEQEADRVAEKVMMMPQPQLQAAPA